MQLGNIGRALVSGGIIYVVMAACAASDGGSLWKGEIDDGGLGGSGGRDGDAFADSSDGKEGPSDSGDDTGGWLDAALDAITDPVPDAAAAEDGTKDGSRLKARYYVSEDGARQFAGWFDTQRGEECSFLLAADGKRRCLPTTQIMGWANWFRDEDCTQVLIENYPGCASADRALVYDATFGSCGPGYRMRAHPIVDKISSATIYVRNIDGVCTATSGGTAEFFQLGAEIPASSFVAAGIE